MKVIQYGCGKMAKYTMRYVLENGWDIVGAVDINPNVIGKDISEVIGCENVGVKITSVEDADALFNTGRGRSNHRNNMMDKDMKTDDIFDLEPL